MAVKLNLFSFNTPEILMQGKPPPHPLPPIQLQPPGEAVLNIHVSVLSTNLPAPAAAVQPHAEKIQIQHSDLWE